MSYKLAIFDLDGTLLNTIRDLADSVNYALEKNGFPKRTLEEVTKFVGNGIRKLVVRAVPKGTDEHMTDVVFEDFKEYYGKHCADKTKKYPGQTARICDNQQTLCDEQRISVTSD